MDSTDLATLYNASSVLVHPARVPDSIRIATLRAAYDSPGVTRSSSNCHRARR